MDDRFESPHWSWIQALLLVLTNREEAVKLAAHKPGQTRLLDLNIGPDGLDIDPPDELDSFMLPEPGEPTCFATEEELICEAIKRYGKVMSLDAARKVLIKAEADGHLHTYTDPSGDHFFDRAAVLRLVGVDSFEEHRTAEKPVAASGPAACAPEEAPTGSTGEHAYEVPRKRRCRARDKGEDAQRKTRILTVFAQADTRFCNAKTRLSRWRIAELLCERNSSGKVEGFARNTVYQILAGRYGPMKRLGILPPEWLHNLNGSGRRDQDLTDKAIV